MYSTNFVEVEGNLGRDAETRATANKPVASFSVAVWIAKEKTLWLDVSFFDEQAPAIAAELKKGDKVIVRGRLDFWKTKEGTERVQIMASQVYKIGKTPRGDVRDAQPTRSQVPQRQSTSAIDDVDIPF